MSKESVLKTRRKILIIDVIAMLFAGSVYCWSVYVAPFEAAFGWSRTQTSLTYSLLVVCNTVIGVLAAFLAKRKFTYRQIMCAAAVAAAGGLILVSQMTQLWQLYVGFSLLFAGSMGAVYNALITTISQWYQDNPALCSGVLLMCYGCSAMFFGPMFNACIEAYGFRTLFLILGICALVLFLACSVAARAPKEEELLLLPKGKVAQKQAAARSYKPAEMVRTPIFWMFCIWMITVAACGMTLSSHASPMAQSISVSAATAAVFTGLQSGGSGAGRVIFGFVYDKIGKKTLICVSACAIIGSILLNIALNAAVPALMAVSFFILGLAFGGSPVSSTGFTKETFGSEYYGINLSVANLSVLVSSFIGPYIAAWIYEVNGYSTVCILITCFAVAASLLSIIVAFTKRK